MRPFATLKLVLPRSLRINCGESDADKQAPAGMSMEMAREIAEDIVASPPLAVRWAKAAVNQQVMMMFTLNMRLGLATEALTFLSQDHVEAVHALVEI